MRNIDVKFKELKNWKRNEGIQKKKLKTDISEEVKERL